MKGREFIAFASKVALLHAEEAARRSAISRAYYGAMHESLELLRSCGLPMDARHDVVSRDLKASLSQEGLEIGYLVDNLRTSRVNADYRLDGVIAQSEVLATIERATEAVALLDVIRQKLQQSKWRDQFLSEIRAARVKTGRRS